MRGLRHPRQSARVRLVGNDEERLREVAKKLLHGHRPPGDMPLRDLYALQAMTGVWVGEEIANRIRCSVQLRRGKYPAGAAWAAYLNHPLVNARLRAR